MGKIRADWEKERAHVADVRRILVDTSQQSVFSDDTQDDPRYGSSCIL